MTTPEVEYILGHSDHEIRRLAAQAEILRPITHRLLKEAGVSPGMRVLDVGCGTGEVSTLVANLVGPAGNVVGIDRSASATTVAKARAHEAGLSNVVFHTSSFEEFSSSEPFDMIIGRYVLIHQPDPTNMLAAAARMIRPGGVIAFHELSTQIDVQSVPNVPLWQQVGEWVWKTFEATAPHFRAGSRFIDYFARAGLPEPAIFCEVPVGGGPDSPLYAWLAGVFRSVLPQFVKLGIGSADEVDIETLEERLRSAVVAANSQVTIVGQFCAWARLP